jgi:hypothetical protein
MRLAAGLKDQSKIAAHNVDVDREHRYVVCKAHPACMYDRRESK